MTTQRKLREYKGIRYTGGKWRTKTRPIPDYDYGVSNIYTALGIMLDDPTDADHAALLALRDDPWEPVETLEEVVRAWWLQWDPRDEPTVRVLNLPQIELTASDVDPYEVSRDPADEGAGGDRVRCAR